MSGDGSYGKPIGKNCCMNQFAQVIRKRSVIDNNLTTDDSFLRFVPNKERIMSNSAARLIALSIALLAGATLLSVGSIAQSMNPNRGHEAQLFGIALSLVGGIRLALEISVSTRIDSDARPKI